MKRGFLVFSLILILALPTVSATPYWVKPGVYIEYASMRYEPYVKMFPPTRPPTTAKIFYWNHTRENWTRIKAYGTTFITFKIVGEDDEFFTVMASLEMKNVTILMEGTPFRFLNLTEFVLNGTYKIRKNDSMVFDHNGTCYGHTVLWIDTTQPPHPNETFTIIPQLNWKSKVWALQSEKTHLKTYFSEFNPPIGVVSLYGDPLTIPNEISFSKYLDAVRYDASTGLVLSFSTVLALVPDLEAIGIRIAMFEDERGSYEHWEGKESNWAQGLILYDTNAQFQEAEKVPFSKAKTPAEYVFCGSLLLVGAVLGVKSFRGTKK